MSSPLWAGAWHGGIPEAELPPIIPAPGLQVTPPDEAQSNSSCVLKSPAKAMCARSIVYGFLRTLWGRGQSPHSSEEEAEAQRLRGLSTATSWSVAEPDCNPDLKGAHGCVPGVPSPPQPGLALRGGRAQSLGSRFPAWVPQGCGLRPSGVLEGEPRPHTLPGQASLRCLAPRPGPCCHPSPCSWEPGLTQRLIPLAEQEVGRPKEREAV